MKCLRSPARLILLLLLIQPLPAHAAGSDIAAIFIGIIEAIALPQIWLTVAILVSVIAGLTLMLSHDEGALGKARTALGSVAGGVILLTIFLTLGATNTVSVVYNGFAGSIFANSANAIGIEAAGLADWIATIAVVIGILVVIIAATRAVLSFGDEGEYAKVRASILHVIIGLIVIGAAYIFQQVFFIDREPTALLLLFLNPILVILGIIGLVAVLILIYAGFRMIISFGREDDFSAAKSLIFRVIIGLVIILVSFTLIAVIKAVFT